MIGDGIDGGRETQEASRAIQNLSSQVTLNANTTYYIVSQETSGGDQWYDINTTIQTANVASETTGVWSPDGVTYNLYGSPDESYGPLSFLYATATVSTAPMITQQPQNATIAVNGTATFTVGASGGNLTYQWWSEAPAGTSFTQISGATGDELRNARRRIGGEWYAV